MDVSEQCTDQGFLRVWKCEIDKPRDDFVQLAFPLDIVDAFLHDLAVIYFLEVSFGIRQSEDVSEVTQQDDWGHSLLGVLV